MPHVELDSLHHLPNWVERPLDEFRTLVETELAGQRWVCDGNYTRKVQDIVWQRADTVVYLDVSRFTAMRRVINRSLRRLVTREELWNGNRESLHSLLSPDPARNIVLWTWTHHETYRRHYEVVRTDSRWSELNWIVLRSPRAARRYLEVVIDA